MRALLLAALLAPLLAAPTPAAAQPAPEAPFVEHRLTLQLSDADPAKQTAVLNVANNVLTAFGPDKVAIEVVAFGAGIDLLRTPNPNQTRISSLIAQGVTFDACNNTIETIERETGKPFPLNPQARRVQAGAVQIMLLSEKGYTLIRP